MNVNLPSLQQSLQGRDLSFLRIVAGLWAVDFTAPDARVGLQRLPPLLLERERVNEMVELLPAEAQQALRDLAANAGYLPWPLFTRRYGTVREMGPAKRDRVRPYDNPASPAEALWYRGMIGRAFFDTPSGPQEFAFIPADVLDLLSIDERAPDELLGRPATQAERSHPIPTTDRILDHTCTFLAALRLGWSAEELARLVEGWQTASPYPLTPGVLHDLLLAAGLIDQNGQPQSEPVRLFLEAGRGEALRQLATAWLHSDQFNELRQLPSLKMEGEWQNDPLRARELVLDFLSTVPTGVWWSLNAFTGAIRQAYPDYQRPAGDYDSWFIKDKSSGEYLRGFSCWDQVDGALIRYLIGGPLHWLGLIDLATAEPGGPLTAFRWAEWAESLLRDQAPDGLPEESKKLLTGSDARLRAPRLAPRAVRYLVARFTEWEGENGNEYLYRITPAALRAAQRQGLRIGHLLGLLGRHATNVPPSLRRALDRWEERGSEARLERVTVLRLGSSDLLAALRNSKAARFLGDPLGPTTVVVKPGAWKKVLAILAEMGYLGEVKGLDEKEEAP